MTATQILQLIVSAIGVAAAVYNILSAGKKVKENRDHDKLDAAYSMGKENKQELQNLKERMDERDRNTKESLKKIEDDVAEVKKLFTDFLLKKLNTLL